MISKHTWRLICCLLCCLAVRCVNCSGILNSSLTQTQESHTWPQTDFNPQFSNLSEVLLIFICLTRQWARVEEDWGEKEHNKERKCEKQDSGKERHEYYHSREKEIGDLKKTGYTQSGTEPSAKGFKGGSLMHQSHFSIPFPRLFLRSE